MAKQDRAFYFKTIGKNLRALRLEHGLTQKNIADMLGVSFQQVQKYETGQNKLPIESLLALKNYYNASFEIFFEGLSTLSQQNLKGVPNNERILEQLGAMPDEHMKRKILKVVQILIP